MRNSQAHAHNERDKNSLFLFCCRITRRGLGWCLLVLLPFVYGLFLHQIKTLHCFSCRLCFPLAHAISLEICWRVFTSLSLAGLGAGRDKSPPSCRLHRIRKSSQIYKLLTCKECARYTRGCRPEENNHNTMQKLLQQQHDASACFSHFSPSFNRQRLLVIPARPPRGSRATFANAREREERIEKCSTPHPAAPADEGVRIFCGCCRGFQLSSFPFDSAALLWKGFAFYSASRFH